MLAGRLMARQRNNWSGHAMAVGDGGAIFYSNNGKSWTDRGWVGGLRNEAITGRSATDGAGTVLIGTNDAKLYKTTDAGTTWTEVTGHPFTWEIFGIQYVNGRWYVTDGGSDVRYSTDLVNWTSVTYSGGSPTIDESTGIFSFSMCYDGSGTYVMFASGAGSAPAYLYSSSDGATFTRRVTLSGSPIIRGAVAYGAGHFVFCGQDGVIRESSDGTTWNTRSPAGGILPDFSDVKFANGIFMAVAGATLESVQTSPDGITWTNYTAPGDLLAVSFRSSSSTWVAVGYNGSSVYQAWTSTDNGATWTSRTFASSSACPMMDVVYDATNDRFLIIGPGPDGGELLHTQVSQTGTTWTKTFVKVTGVKSNVNFNAVQNDGAGHWVAVGSFGVIIYSTDNGATWTQVNIAPTAFPVYSVGFHDSMTPKWVAVGAEGITATSSDGITWTPDTNSTAMDLVDIACNGTTWVGADANGSVWTSTNGTTWTERALSTSTFTPAWCTAIEWNGSVFCAMVMNSAFTDLESQTSADGITWTSRNDPTGGKTQRLYNLTWADGKFRAYSVSGGDLYTSADGITWTEEFGSYGFNLDDAGFADHAECLAFSETGAGNKMFMLAFGQSAMAAPLAWSIDGVALNFASGIPQTSYVRAVHAYTDA